MISERKNNSSTKHKIKKIKKWNCSCPRPISKFP